MRYTKETNNTPDLQYAYPGDAGLDLYIDSDRVVLPPHKVVHIPTGICVQLPDKHFGLVAIRGSLGMCGVTIANGIGVIDQSYTGEIALFLLNVTDEDVVLDKNEKVAQLLVLPVTTVIPRQATHLSVHGRGDRGFGSSGTGITTPEQEQPKKRCACKGSLTRSDMLAEPTHRPGDALRETRLWRHERPRSGVRLG